MRSRSMLSGGLAALLVLSGAAPPPGAAALTISADTVAARRAAAWVTAQQEPDGGFEVADFPGFETPEAVLAVAAAAPRGATWSARQGLTAVQAASTVTGRTALDYLDDFADGSGDLALTGGQAARLIVLVASPLCLDPTSFDPQHDGATNLVARMDTAAQPDGGFGVFSDTLYAALAMASIGRAVPAATVARIKAAQQADGGYNFSGEPAPTGFGDDVDTTGLAVQALVAAGVPATDPSVAKAIDRLRAIQQPDGSWNGDPNSTAIASLAFVAAGSNGAALNAAYAFLRGQQQPDGRIASPNDSFGVNTFASSQAARALLRARLPVTVDPGTCLGRGYALFAADGGVLTFGGAGFHGSAGATPLNAPVVGGAASASGNGYYLFAADGGVFAYGDAVFRGSAVGRTSAPIVGGAVMPDGSGYALFGADGSTREFGNDMPTGGSIRALAAPVVGGAVTPKGDGVYEFAADGGVFALGHAAFRGSMGGRRLNSPVVGGAVTPTGRGYLLFAADGGVFTFGDARFLGSMGGRRLNSPIVGGAVTPTGRGYLLFAADGGVFTFGDASFAGSAGGLRLNRPVVAAALD